MRRKRTWRRRARLCVHESVLDARLLRLVEEPDEDDVFVIFHECLSTLEQLCGYVVEEHEIILRVQHEAGTRLFLAQVCGESRREVSRARGVAVEERMLMLRRFTLLFGDNVNGARVTDDVAAQARDEG